jgi:ATP-dependent exoDNAse (exonuclease V) beta subunit
MGWGIHSVTYANDILSMQRALPIAALRDLMSAHTRLLATFPELDYGARADAKYIGPLLVQLNAPTVDWPLKLDQVLTGHIDIVQIRNGAIHILDCKPGANHEKPIAQLMVYALALSRRTGLKLYDFVCAWFDERNYFEFYPLHVVHKRRS